MSRNSDLKAVTASVSTSIGNITSTTTELPVPPASPRARVFRLSTLPETSRASRRSARPSGLSIIEPGGLHIMQAGAGMHHDEFPKAEGVETRGFQIWFNHAEKDRLVMPKLINVAPNEVPEVEDQHARIGIVHGANAGKSTPRVF